MFDVKILIDEGTGFHTIVRDFVSPSDAIHFAVEKHGELTERFKSGDIVFCSIAVTFPEIGELGWLY